MNLEISNKICVLKARYLRQTSSLNFFCINNINDPNSIHTLLFEDSRLLALPQQAFYFYTEATEIYLNNSGIREIHPNAFARNQKLQKLYLNNNNITRLSAGCFNFLKSLEILDISSNFLSSVSAATFDDLTHLKVLNLSGNSLMRISHLQFNFIENLQILDLSHNMIIDINPLLLLKFVILEKLLINGNQIKRLILKSYNKTELILLDASFNQLDSIDTPDFFEMKMNNNDFKTEIHIGSTVSDVSKNNFVGFIITSSKSQLFNASYNKIKGLSCNNFNKAQDLKVIDLSHNLIQDIALHTFDTLKDLSNLNLSNNLLTEIEFGTFHQLIHLEILDLSYNKFNFLYKTPHEGIFNFCHLTRLYKVDLSGNLWSNDILDKINPAKCISPYVEEITTIKPKEISFDNSNMQSKGVPFLVLKYEDINRILFKYFGNEFFTSNFTKYLHKLNDFENRLRNVEENNFYILVCSVFMIFILLIAMILLLVVVCKRNNGFIV